MSWLVQPTLADETYALRGEHPLDWLARSTSARAQECRRFLDEHMGMLPIEKQTLMATDLRERWNSTFFEIIVARLMQEFGAEIAFDAAHANGRRPDFTAAFSEGSVFIEAKSPIFIGDASEEAENQIPLLDFIESKIPHGWSVGVWELPFIGPDASKQEFKNAVQSRLAVPPPSGEVKEIEIVEEMAGGTLHLHLIPSHREYGRLTWETPIAVFDNSHSRIVHAIESQPNPKRPIDMPLLLAIQATGLNSSFADFDCALFGSHSNGNGYGLNGGAIGFVPDGYLAKTDGTIPPYAGVLAFLDVGFDVCTEPVLYLNPHYTGSLPRAVLQLEQRTYNPAQNRIEKRASHMGDAIDRLNLVTI